MEPQNFLQRAKKWRRIKNKVNVLDAALKNASEKDIVIPWVHFIKIRAWSFTKPFSSVMGPTGAGKSTVGITMRCDIVSTA
jgi:hypothetical protein